MGAPGQPDALCGWSHPSDCIKPVIRHPRDVTVAACCMLLLCIISCWLCCRGVAQNKELEDLFIAPFAVPRPPQRFYYIFQAPVHTSREDLKDPARVDALYREARRFPLPVLG